MFLTKLKIGISICINENILVYWIGSKITVANEKVLSFKILGYETHFGQSVSIFCFYQAED
jgi:hypothetical protein